MNLKEISKERRTIKSYDKDKKINDKDWEEIIDFAHNSPTSMNWQTWRAIIVDRDSEFMRKITPNEMMYNTQNAHDAHKTVFFVSPNNDGYEKTEFKSKRIAESIRLKSLINGEKINIEDIEEEKISRGLESLKTWFNQDFESWGIKQGYIGASFMVIAATSLGIDTTMMEGINVKNMNSLLLENELITEHETTYLAVTFGYRTKDYKMLPTSRDPKNVKFTNSK